jgi:cysteine desulfurase
MDSDCEHVKRLSAKLHTEMMKMKDVQLNGDAKLRYPGIMNYSFEYVEGESLIMAIKNIAVSSGSACTSASLEPSYVLRSIGLGPELAHTSIRFGIG